MQTLEARPVPPPRGETGLRSVRRNGFTLIELLIVVALIGILASISMVNLRGALLGAKAQATASDLRILQNAVRAVSGDCSTLPVWAAESDPGFTFQPSWAAGSCWKGPYLNTWMTSTPLGGTFAYVGETASPPILRVAGINAGAAQVLASKVQAQFGPSALRSVSKSGEAWTVDLVIWEAVNVGTQGSTSEEDEKAKKDKEEKEKKEKDEKEKKDKNDG
jgi:prepilin-type N-terminal cleavage/methylation domain-containing protein